MYKISFNKQRKPKETISMTIISSLRFLYILGGPGLLCATLFDSSTVAIRKSRIQKIWSGGMKYLLFSSEIQILVLGTGILYAFVFENKILWHVILIQKLYSLITKRNHKRFTIMILSDLTTIQLLFR